MSRMGLWIRCFVFVVLSALLPAVASAQNAVLNSTSALAGKRVALVIGNSSYRNAPILKNPRNDARDIAKALQSLGFDVINVLDADKLAMDGAIRKFSEALANSDLGIFFYAGHALQVAGKNYLLPIDAKAANEDALEFEMIRLDTIQALMERKTKTNVLFLDACRNNPLARNLARSLGTRSASVEVGLAKIEAGVGTLISFSTQPENVASDGVDRNSPYTGALKRHITEPGENLTDILIEVRRDVIIATQNKQVPWDQHALTANLYLNGMPKAGTKGEPNPARSEVAARLQTILTNYGCYQGAIDGIWTKESEQALAWYARTNTQELENLDATFENISRIEGGGVTAACSDSGPKAKGCSPKYGARILSEPNPTKIHPDWTGDAEIGTSWSLSENQDIANSSGR